MFDFKIMKKRYYLVNLSNHFAIKKLYIELDIAHPTMYILYCTLYKLFIC